MLPPDTMARRHLPYLLALVVGFGTISAESAEPKTHVVAFGQRLGSIAKRYGVSIEALCSANGITRRDPIRPGQRLAIPGRGATVARAVEVPVESTQLSHRVESGQRLGSIAERYGVTIDALCQENRIQRRSVLRPGQMLRIPGKVVGAPRLRGDDDPSQPSAYARVPKRRGYVELVGHTQRFRGHVFDKRGKLLPAARSGFARVLGVGGDDPRLDERLVRMLVDVSDHFGGRPLRIVSGYRTTSYVKDSRHKQNRAVDFSVPGVPNEVVRDYARRFAKVGVGYYPNSSFVHLDVREYAAYWVDYARPGEAPRRSPTREAVAVEDLHDEEPEGSGAPAVVPALDTGGATPGAPPETVPASVVRPAPAKALLRPAPTGS
jgi:LysM repeat protein